MDDPWATVRRIAGDRTSGAAEIATEAARALADLPKRRMGDAIRLLLQGHPSMAPLWRLATEVLLAAEPRDAARDFISALESDHAAVEVLAPVVSGRRVLTISYSSSIVALVRRTKPGTVLCMRSEPGGEGAHAAEAISEWTNAVLIEDADAIRDVPADVVVVGADAVTPTAIINKVKTRALAEAALAKRIHAYVVAGETKFIGAELPPEPSFEPTPLDLIFAIATPVGLLDPKDAGKRAQARRVHPELLRLLDELSGGPA
jgi:translation initiation factor 2B subunit (eIF-2B alpha/beta/delta family)